MGFIAGVKRLFGVDYGDAEDSEYVSYEMPARERRPQTARREFDRAAWDERDQQFQPRLREPERLLRNETEAGQRERVINHPSAATETVYVVRPQMKDSDKPDFSMKQYAGYLLTRQALVLDVNLLAADDLEEATRLVDYLSGVAEAVEGAVWEVTKNIFIFAPNNISLAGDPLKQLEVY